MDQRLAHSDPDPNPGFLELPELDQDPGLNTAFLSLLELDQYPDPKPRFPIIVKA